jgi:16S rRNA (cytosine967-C5)-methyltransferase
VLLDAPCSSTGTIRRHPDIPWLKSEADIVVLTSLQQRLLDRAVDLLKPGATLVYCVCSLEPEEAEDQITALLARDPRVTRAPVAAQEVCGRAEFLTADGDLRTLPPQLPDPDPRWGGLDGFYAARLTRKA